jgi:hypothetical protein
MSATARRLVIAAAILSWGATASAQTADEVVERYLTALGGRAALGKLTSRSTTGTMTLSTPNGEISGPIEVLAQRPNKSRTLIKLDLTALGAGPMVVDQRFDGTSGYVIDTLQGNRDVTGNQLDNMKNGMFPQPPPELQRQRRDRGARRQGEGRRPRGVRAHHETQERLRRPPVH